MTSDDDLRNIFDEPTQYESARGDGYDITQYGRNLLQGVDAADALGYLGRVRRIFHYLRFRLPNRRHVDLPFWPVTGGSFENQQLERQIQRALQYVGATYVGVDVGGVMQSAGTDSVTYGLRLILRVLNAEWVFGYRIVFTRPSLVEALEQICDEFPRIGRDYDTLLDRDAHGDVEQFLTRFPEIEVPPRGDFDVYLLGVFEADDIDARRRNLIAVLNAVDTLYGFCAFGREARLA